jgi:hypothetical protein
MTRGYTLSGTDVKADTCNFNIAGENSGGDVLSFLAVQVVVEYNREGLVVRESLADRQSGCLGA